MGKVLDNSVSMYHIYLVLIIISCLSFTIIISDVMKREIFSGLDQAFTLISTFYVLCMYHTM